MKHHERKKKIGKPRLRLIKNEEVTTKQKATKENPLVAQLTELADKIDQEIKRLMEG